MSADILKELDRLEALSNSSGGGPSKSKAKSKSKSAVAAGADAASSESSCIPAVLSSLDDAFTRAQERIRDGEDAETVLRSVLDEVERSRSGVDRGLKEWYSALGKVGKAIDKKFPPQLNALSAAYDLPPPTYSSAEPALLLSSAEAQSAMDRAIMESLARQGAWDAVRAMEGETGVRYADREERVRRGMQDVRRDLERGEVDSALEWTSKHHHYLAAPPHPSPLPFYLHRARYVHLLLTAPSSSPSSTPPALQYARDHLFPFLPTHASAIYHLLGALLYPPAALPGSPYADLLGAEYAPRALVGLFESEYCRLHGLPREDPLSVVVEIGAGGPLSRIDKGRRVVESRMGPVRAWDELPMEIPLPPHRRYHSIFACPVSKEQATESNPPKMLSCGHVIAHDSLMKLSKHGRSVKCPYCPMETAVPSALRLYF